MKKWQALAPLLFTVLGFTLLSVATYVQFLKPRPLAFLIAQLSLVSSYVLYMIYESRISFTEVNKEKSEHDRSTMELAALIKISLLLSCLGIGNTLVGEKHYLIVAVSGVVFTFLGFLIRASAIKTLGDRYGHRIRPVSDQVIDKGIFSFIRHGAYSGTFFIHLGVTMVFMNFYSLVFLFLWLGVVVLRIELEDRLLQENEDYKRYSKKTPYKMIPWIW